MLTRTFSLLILMLAFVCGFVLFFHAPAASMPQALSGRDRETRTVSFSSEILSRLSLFPGFRSRPIPIAVVIENHEDARPYQEGLADALMVQEYLVEGFIARFIALFDARYLPVEIGPVRSLRSYFLDGVEAWTLTVFHAGGSPEALDRVQRGDTFFARNLLYFDDETASLRKKGVSPPHDLFLQKKFLMSLLEEVPERLLQPVPWPPFPVGTPDGDGQTAQTIRLNFFSRVHDVVFTFEPIAEKYERMNGDTLSDARPSTVIVLEVPIDSLGEYGRLSMTLTGEGRALVFHSGTVWEGRWARENVEDSFRIVDDRGEAIPVRYGQIWMTVLPTLDRVSWE